MQFVCARNNVLSVVALAVASCAASASASIHATYEIRPKFKTDGFSASWLYEANAVLGDSSAVDNGSLLSGSRTSRISGGLEGDLTGNLLENVSGSVTGNLKQLAGQLNTAFLTSFSTSTPFELRLGTFAAVGGAGTLAFETNGAGTGEFTGGFLDFSLHVDGSDDSLVSGTFFFKPQAESGSDTLSPNRGTDQEFTLWGWNWMHDGAPVTGDEPEWADFLGPSGVDYTGPNVYRTRPSGGRGVSLPLGIALYVLDPDAGDSEPLHNPEPTTLVVWGLLATVVMVVIRRRA